MSTNKDWDNAFTGAELRGTVDQSPAYDIGEITALAGATIAAELLCLYATNPNR
jgi:agmatinase